MAKLNKTQLMELNRAKSKVIDWMRMAERGDCSVKLINDERDYVVQFGEDMRYAYEALSAVTDGR